MILYFYFHKALSQLCLRLEMWDSYYIFTQASSYILHKQIPSETSGVKDLEFAIVAIKVSVSK